MLISKVYSVTIIHMLLNLVNNIHIVSPIYTRRKCRKLLFLNLFVVFIYFCSLKVAFDVHK